MERSRICEFSEPGTDPDHQGLKRPGERASRRRETDQPLLRRELTGDEQVAY